MVWIQLLLHEPSVPAGPSGETLFGGAPSVADGFAWPTCTSCGGNMQFLGQVRRHDADRLLLVFMCQNDAGMCDEWDAEEGGNRVIAVASGALRLADVPDEGAVTRPRHGARLERVEADRYGTARREWGERHAGRQREVLGQIGGDPDWLQADETPACDSCGRALVLAAQLETGPAYATEMNFAGGCGYVFDCDCAEATPKFLWQS